MNIELSIRLNRDVRSRSVQTITNRPIKAAEVWVPNTKQDQLVWHQGEYGTHASLEQISRETTFARGEGLPGRVWESRAPEVMHDLFDGGFKRDGVAAEAGLSSGIAMPILRAERCTAVVTFLCDAGDFAEGAFEVWGRNDRNELSLRSSYYANLDRFGRVSQFVKFPRRAGLPGIVWEKRKPILLSGIGTSKNFMRAAGARAEGLDVGLGIPVMHDVTELDSVVVMLSSLKTPMARVFEVWSTIVEKPEEVADEPQEAVLKAASLESASYGELTTLAHASEGLVVAKGEGIVGKVLESQLPYITSDCPESDTMRGDALRESGCSDGIGIPVFVAGVMTAVVVMIS